MKKYVKKGWKMRWTWKLKENTCGNEQISNIIAWNAQEIYNLNKFLLFRMHPYIY